jgi:hypothetical protein
MGQLVSCLCVSQPSRYGMLQRAIIDWEFQTYPDRELLIAVNDPHYAEQIRMFVESRLISDRVRVLQRDQRDQATLLLHAQAASRGEFLAAWDDDNLNAPDRLERQVKASSPFVGSVTALGSALYYFYDSNEVFFVELDRPAVPLSQRSAVTTLLIPRYRMPAWPPTAKTNSVLANFSDSCSRQKQSVVVLSEFLGAHLIGVRGDNLRGEEYHRRVAISSPLTWQAERLTMSHDAVSAVLDQYHWDAPKVTVAGRGAPAFTYIPKRRWAEVCALYPVGDPHDEVVRVTENVG